MKAAKLSKHRHNKDLGRSGEELAANHLKEIGYSILELNWRCSMGEIDIIASRNNILYLVEVKTRSSNRFGEPSEAINYRKLRRMNLVANLYISKKNYSGLAQLLVVEVTQGLCNLIEIN